MTKIIQKLIRILGKNKKCLYYEYIRSINIDLIEKNNNLLNEQDQVQSAEKEESKLIKCCKSYKIICWDQVSNGTRIMAVLSVILILLSISYLFYSLFIHG